MKIPSNITTVVMDLDGTIYLSNTLIAGAAEAIERMRRTRRVLFLTNNTSVSGNAYVKKLNGLGIPALRQDIITSGDATAFYLNGLEPKKRVYVVGTEDFKSELALKGVIIDEDDPDAVLIAFDTSVTYRKLERACDLIRNGAAFYATHPDINCPKTAGFMPDVGSFLALIEKSTGRKPDLVCGKPERTMTQYLMNFSGAKPQEIMMIGDRLYTDIEFAISSGFVSCLTLSGETDPLSAKKYNKKIDFIIGSIAELE